MKKIILSAFFAVFANLASAEIAVVDTQYIFENAKMTQEVKAQILELTKKTKDEIQVKEDALGKKQEELIAKKSVLTTDVYAEKETALKQEIIEFRRSLKKVQQDLNFKNKEKKQQIAEKISTAVEAVSKAKGYDMVIAKTFVIYNKDTVEITKEVLEEVNKK